MNKKWEIKSAYDKKYDKIFHAYPEVVRKLLSARGITTSSDAREFFKEEDLNFNDPFDLYKADEFADKLITEIKKNQKIFIHGDYDVDGICATSLLWDFLYKKLNIDVLPFIPSRFTEGYGMSDSSIDRIADEGGKVVITVDCGIRDDKLIKKRKEIKFFITDHHSFAEVDNNPYVPKNACGVLHPAHPLGKYPQKEISGTAVAWKLVQILAKKLKLDVNTDEYLDLVTLSTICDIMPLTKENRSIVKQGLKVIGETKRIGLLRLISDAGLDKTKITTYDIGFVIGPRLNAAGRIDHAMEAVRLLVTDSYIQAREISKKLNDLNATRQQIQQNIYDEAVRQISVSGIESKLYFVWGEEWQEGVIGIVAGKLCENYNRPVLIATRKGVSFTGSARSISSFNIINAISTQSDLLERFGGHAQAAGFTVGEKNIEKFKENLIKIVDESLSDDDLALKIQYDCEISISDISQDLYDLIRKFSPFGFGNPTPKFLMKNIEFYSVSTVGKDSKHLKVSVLNKKTGELIEGIGFGLGYFYKNLKSNKKCDIVFSLDENEWNGTKKLQMNIKDLKINKNSKLKSQNYED